MTAGANKIASRGTAARKLRPMMAISALFVLAGIASHQVCGAASAAETLPQDTPPLHQQIDREIESSLAGTPHQPSVTATDTEFLRRVYLDLTGRIPPAADARVFLEDTAADKRLQLVDRLLGSPQHVRHLQYVFDALLMQRKAQRHVQLDEWRRYLFRALRENWGWDRLAGELLSADGAADDNRAAARFFLDRQLKIDETVRDIGRVFLGRDLQCAQCHDHPEIDDYAQRHYYGLAAFLQRSYLFTEPKSKRVSIGEKAEGTVKFTSVFTSEENQTQPRILDLAEVQDPPPDQEPYRVKPGKGARGVPKYSRRLQLAPALTSDQNRAFRYNIANRIWALLMGRGLVEPLDMFHAANPPTHPQLLELLADDLRAHGYDLRHLIRELVLSRAYQRSSLLAAGDGQTNDRGYVTAQLKPLTAEQLAWSTMQALGVIDAARAELAEPSDQESPTAEDEFQIEAKLHSKLSQHVAVFVETFAAGAEQPGFGATADHALFLLNDPLITQWLQPAAGNLCQQLLDLADKPSIARQVYLSVLTRYPSEAESQRVVDFLAQFGEDQQSGIQELVRTILCSAEFRLNH